MNYEKAHNEKISRTLDSNPKASRKAPITDILQTYRNDIPRKVPTKPRSYLIQRVTDEELTEIAGKIKEKIDSGTLPDKGINLWELQKQNKVLYLLGTSHGVELNKMGDGDPNLLSYLINFLQTTEFSQVFTEIDESEDNIMRNLSYQSDVFEKIQRRKILEQEQQDPSKNNKAKLRIVGQINNINNPYHGAKIDISYAALATLRADRRKIPYKFLETNETRTQAYIKNGIDMNLTQDPAYPDRIIYIDPDSKITYNEEDSALSEEEEDTIQGNQKKLFEEAYAKKNKKRDIGDCEERNSQWMAKEEALEDKTLWIIGAAHLPGLIVRFEKLGWTTAHKTP